MKVRIVTGGDGNGPSRAANTKIINVDTGEELRVTKIDLKIVDGTWTVNLESYYVGFDVIATVGSHIVKCFRCNDKQERIDVEELIVEPKKNV